MRCPNCGHEQKYSTGMTCQKCKYQYVFNPKKDGITDNKVNNMLQEISNQDTYYFTHTQLILMIGQYFHSKNAPQYVIYIVLAVIGLILSLFLSGFFQIMAHIAFGIGVGMILYYLTQKGKVPVKPGIELSKVEGIIQRYQSKYPEKFEKMMTEGGRLTNGALADADITAFAPEKIVIIDDKSMVDMLIYNRVHLRNKAAIVSAEGYPENVYRATKDFVRNQPDIPVYTLHSASHKNLNYPMSLKATEKWKHLGDNIKDLGLNWSDLQKANKSLPYIANRKIYFNKFSRDFITKNRAVLPLDFSQPAALVAGIGAGLIAGGLMIEHFITAEDPNKVQDYG